MSMAARARSIAAEAFGIPAQDLPDTVRLGAFERWDSLAHLRLLLAIEAELGRKLKPEEASGIMSLNDIESLFRAQANARQAGE